VRTVGRSGDSTAVDLVRSRLWFCLWAQTPPIGSCRHTGAHGTRTGALMSWPSGCELEDQLADGRGPHAARCDQLTDGLWTCSPYPCGPVRRGCRGGLGARDGVLSDPAAAAPARRGLGSDPSALSREDIT